MLRTRALAKCSSRCRRNRFLDVRSTSDEQPNLRSLFMDRTINVCVRTMLLYRSDGLATIIIIVTDTMSKVKSGESAIRSRLARSRNLRTYYYIGPRNTIRNELITVYARSESSRSRYAIYICGIDN